MRRQKEWRGNYIVERKYQHFLIFIKTNTSKMKHYEATRADVYSFLTWFWTCFPLIIHCSLWCSTIRYTTSACNTTSMTFSIQTTLFSDRLVIIFSIRLEQNEKLNFLTRVVYQKKMHFINAITIKWNYALIKYGTDTENSFVNTEKLSNSWGPKTWEKQNPSWKVTDQ